MATPQAMLAKFSPYDSLSEEQLAELAPLVKLETLPAGKFIHRRGKPIEAYAYLLRGRVDLVDMQFARESVAHDEERSGQPLSTESPSPVAVQAKTEVELLLVKREALDQVDRWRETAAMREFQVEHGVDTGELDQQDWMLSLLDSPLFTQIPPAQLQQLFQRFVPVEVATGDVVIKEGQPGDYFYVIESGRAKVTSLAQGNLAELGPGQYFGEEALVGDTIRNASIVMTQGGVLMRLDQEDFKNLLQAPLLRYIHGDQINQQAQAGVRYQLLDVRLPVEYRIAHVADSINIPLAVLRRKMQELDTAAVYVVTGDGGKRAEVAAHLMCQAGFTTYILDNSDDYYTGDSPSKPHP